MDIFKLTRELIDIPSVTGDERAVGLFLARYLEDMDFHVELQEVALGRANVIATTSTDAAPRIMLSTHMDTVPPHIVSSEDDEFIYGRGACDAKGIIAAQVEAACRLRAEGKGVGLLFTVDEELGSLGAARANTHEMARHCRYMINGEPTDNLLAVGSKGSLRLILRAKGRAAHSAYPEAGESAIEKLLDALARVRAIEWPRDGVLGETTCNIGVIAGGTRSNVIAAHAEADLHLRLVTKAAPVRELLEQAVGGLAEIEYLSEAAPVHMLAVEGFEQCAVRFMTDIPHLTNWGAPLLLGPGSILVAHTDHERVSKRELQESVELYMRLVRTLLTAETQS